MAYFGQDCGITKVVANRIKTVLTKDGKESKLYKDIKEHLKELPKEDMEALKDMYRSFEGDHIHSVDDMGHLALAIYSRTHSPNFKEWFGASKVVDANGEPLMVFHGSPTPDISEFKAKFKPKNADLLGTKAGLFFTDYLPYAKEVKGDNKEIYPVFLHTVNPDLENREEIDHITAEQSHERGYDGLIGIDYGQTEGKTYVVFDPNQIKSLFNDGNYDKKDNNIYNQIEDKTKKTIPSKQSEVTVKQHEEFLMRNGFDIKPLFEGMTDDQGNKITPENSIDFTEKLVKVIEGEQATALGEESSHLAVRMIKQKFPKLFQEMMNRIGTYSLYEDVVGLYKDNKDYKIDGKPNIPKLKEETIGKVLNEYITKANEGKTEKPDLINQAILWWKRILQNLKSLFNGTGYNPFEKAVEKFENNELEENSKNLKHELQQTIIGTSQNRGSKEENRGELQEKGRDLTKSASNFLQQSQGQYPKDVERGRDENPNPLKPKVDQSIIKKFIDNKNLWYKWGGEQYQKIGEGSEAEVYLAMDGKHVIKTNNLVYYKTWKDYLEHLQLHNFIFPESSMELMGFTKDSMGNIQSVVKQKYIDSKIRPNDKKLDEYLSDIGFERRGLTDYENKELGIKIHDLHRANVVIDKNNDLHFIDTQIFTTPDFYETSDKMYQFSQGDLWTSDQENLGKSIHERILNDNRVVKEEDKDGKSEYKVTIDGKTTAPENRVTDIVKKEIWEPAFRNRKVSESEKKEFEIDAKTGSRLHGYIDNILDRFIDKKTGVKRDIKVDDRVVNPDEDEIYTKLENYISNTLDKFPKDTRFLWEQTLYKPGFKNKPGKDDLVGTPDFIAITPEGVAYNLDWKFMGNKGGIDITNLTQKAHKRQLSLYGVMLRQYGVKEIRESNTIPFKLIYDKKTDDKKLKDIITGNTDYSEIKDKTLLPVPSPQTQPGIKDGEKTIEDKKMTKLVQDLHLLQNKIDKEKTGADWFEQAEKISQINTAIRDLIIKKNVGELINFAKGILSSQIKEMEEITKKLTDPALNSNFTNEEVSDIAFKLIETNLVADTFTGLPITMNDFLSHIPQEELKPLMDKLKSISTSAEYVKSLIYDEKAKTGLIDKLGVNLSDRVGIFNLLSSEKNINGLVKWLNTLSSSRNKTSQVWHHIVSPIKNKIDLLYIDKAKELEKIEDGLNKWAGGQWKNKLSDVKNLLFKKDSKNKNGETRTLISKTSDNFYSELSKKQKEPTSQDKTDILKMIDTESYKKDYEILLEKYKENINRKVFDYNSHQEDPNLRKDTLDQEMREKALENYMDNFDIERTTAFTSNNFRLKKYPKLDLKDVNNSQFSDDYKNLLKDENKPVLDLYDKMQSMWQEGIDMGLMNESHRTFFPQIKRGIVDNLFHGDWKSAKREFLSSFVIEPDDYAAKDPLTQEIINKIHAKYMHDRGEEIKDASGNVTGMDYTGVSDDIFSTLVLMQKEIMSYGELTEIEGIGKLLLTIEEGKKTLDIHEGRITKDSSGNNLATNRNKDNFESLQNQIAFSLYGKKHTRDNIGIDIEVGGKDYFWSFPKTIDTINRQLSLKILGLNIAPALSNLFGGTANSYLRSGKDFHKADIAEGYSRIIEAKTLMTEEGKKFLMLLDHFVPFTDDLSRELGKKLSINEIQKWLSGEGLMTFMRSTDNIVQMANAHAFFKNTMIENGKLVNIREFARHELKYDKKYNLTEEQRTDLDKKVEDKVSELQKKNLYNDSSIKYDEEEKKTTLPGIERAGSSEIQLREKMQQLTRDTLGNRTPEEIAQINMTLLGSSLTMFRNWVPRLAQKRFANFEYNPGSYTYETGTVRQVMDALRGDAEYKLKSVIALISYGVTGRSGENHLIDVAKKDYQRKLIQQRELEGVGVGESMFERRTTETEFIDNYLRGVKSQMRELAATIGLMAAFYAAYGYAQTLNKEDDSYMKRGIVKYSVRMLDKFSDELGFFYSPQSAKNILHGNITTFSALLDMAKFIEAMGKETFYNSTGQEKQAEKNKVLKYPIEYIPWVNEFSQILAPFNEDYNKAIYGSQKGYRYAPLSN